MALKKCRECGTDVSASAKTCPKCGVSNPAKSRGLLTITKIMPFVIAAGFLYMVRGSHNATSSSSADMASEEKPPADLDLTKPLFTAKYAAICPKSLLTTVYPEKISGIFTSIFTRESKLKEYGCTEDLPGKRIYVHYAYSYYLVIDYCDPDTCSPRFFAMKSDLKN